MTSPLYSFSMSPLCSFCAATDLLIGGIEASLWIAEQWAADLRTIFPQLNIVTVSANKLLGLGSTSAFKAFFPGTDTVLPRRINENTCVLMISQSGQTFPTLHATRKLSRLVKDKMWLLTGCFGSKMEQAMVENYKDMVNAALCCIMLYHTVTYRAVRFIILRILMLIRHSIICFFTFSDNNEWFYRAYRMDGTGCSTTILATGLQSHHQ